MPFQSLQSSKKSQVVSIDLGARTTKAVHVQKRGSGLALLNYIIQDAPVTEKGASSEQLGEHLKNVVTALNAKVKHVTLAPGVQDTLLRHAELPAIPVSEMRLMLKHGAKNYLQQELPDHVFDCQILPPAAGAEATKKARVLVGGGKRQLIDELQAAAKAAGFGVDQVIPSLACPANAFELAEPEVFQNEVVALVDMGFRNSTIGVLVNGELTLTRVVGIGGDKLTSGIAEAMSISYPEAEGLKVGLPEEVQTVMQALLMPLGRELRASIDFFEHQHDKTVAQVFFSGGSARSLSIVEMLQTELMIPCKTWNPLGFMELSLPPEQLGEVEQVASQFAVATGGAVASF